MEGMWYVPLLFVVLYHIYVEIVRSRQLNFKIKRMYLKSIPFLVFCSMVIGIMFRIATGITAWVFDAKAPHWNNIVCIIYGWSVQFFAMEFFFICLLWIKLAVVYMDKNMHFDRIVIVDRIIIASVVCSLTFYTTIGVIVLVDPSKSGPIDISWRLYFIGSAALISGTLGFFGIKILKLVDKNKNKTADDELLMTKVKGIIGITTFLGIVLWVINIIYVTIGRDSKAEDWINIGFFVLELINCYSALIIFGRSNTCKKIRVLMGFPETMVGTDSSKTSSNGHEFSITMSRASTLNVPDSKDLENSTQLEVSNLDISVSRE